jgi:formylglycine-generating enzyme required for sulfatase activity
LTYQWQRNEVNVAGATASTLTINNAQTADAGDYRVVLSNGAGTVTSGIAKLIVEGNQTPSRASAFAVIRGGLLSGIVVLNGGSGYLTEPTVNISGGGGTGAIAKAFIDSGRVVEIIVLASGSGYTSAPVIQISEPLSDPLSLSLRLVAAVPNGGTNRADWVLEWSPGPDGPWTVWTTGIIASGQTESIDFERKGHSFRMRPAGGSKTAVAEASVRGGFVSSVGVKDTGAGYSTPPLVTLTGGGGTGATAMAILDGDKVGWIVMVNAGSGYTTAPKAAVGSPPEALSLQHRWVPAIEVSGPQRQNSRMEVGDAILGPWREWTNGLPDPTGTVLADLTPGAVNRFYRAVAEPKASVPDGFVWIPPGTFVMGSPGGEEGRLDSEVQHTVVFTLGFWISDHETTQAEYLAVMGVNPSSFKGMDRPVEQVTWDDAVLYCEKLTQRERLAGRITEQQAYRLPTESEWEYAARARTTGARHGELDAIGWWRGNSFDPTRPVKQKQANAWGLYDMIGNVWEWCGDWYGDYPTGSVTNPTGPGSGSKRVIRGGSWSSYTRSARSGERYGQFPGFRDSDMGFRPVLGAVR